MSLLDLIKQFNKSSIQFGLRHLFQEAVHPKVKYPITKRTYLSSQSTSKITFTTSCSSGYQDVFSTFYKQAVSKLHELIRCNIARRITINLLNDRIVTYLPMPEIK